MEVSDINELLRKIRNDFVRNESGKEAARELFSSLTTKKDWTDEECQSFYEFLLEKYIIDDVLRLGLLKASSGVLEGYRNPRMTAAQQREVYVGEKLPNEPNIDTVLKQENKILYCIATSLKKALDAGTMPKILKEWESPEGKNSPEPSEETRDTGQEQPSATISEGPQDDFMADRKVRKDISKKEQAKRNNYVTTKIKTLLRINNIKIDNRTYQFVSTEPGIDVPKQPRDRKIVLFIPILLVVLLGFAVYIFVSSTVTELFVTEDEIILEPNELFQLNVATIPVSARYISINYVSSNPDVVTVSRNGMLQACESHSVGGIQSSDITIQSKNGITRTKTVYVDFSKDGQPSLNIDINNFKPDFLVTQKIRQEGTSEWCSNIEAEVGDLVEIQIEYVNHSDFSTKDVMIRSILPTALVYIPGSTTVYNGNHPDGVAADRDNLITSGINVGNYASGANGIVRFTAKVVDVALGPGSNTLVNWSQASVGGVTLQDYATVMLQKPE